MNSYCINENGIKFIYYETIKGREFYCCLENLINIFNLNLNIKINNITVINLPFNEVPVTHNSAYTIITYAKSINQFIFQISHELVHFCLFKFILFPEKLKWIEELLAAAMSLHIHKYLDFSYRNYLNLIYEQKLLLNEKEEIQQFLKVNLNALEKSPSFIYASKSYAIFYFRNFDIFKILQDLFKLSQSLQPDANLTVFLSQLQTFAQNQSTFDFVQVLSILI